MKIKIIMIMMLVALACTMTMAQKQEKELRFGLVAQDISAVYPWEIIDASTGACMLNVYEGLTNFAEGSTSVEPALAERWEPSSDYKTWTFYLRRNVKFHNNEIFNADTVIETFKYIKAFSGKMIKVDDYTVKISMNKPNSGLPITLAIQYYAIASKATIESYKKKVNPPAVFGTGPFKFVSWEKGKRIVLEKNNDYWGPKPKVDRVIIIPFKTNDALLQALLDKRIDLTDGIIPNNIPAIRSNPDLYFKSVTGLSTAFVGINTQRKPFNDVKVRKAIAYALNKKAMINKYFYGGQAGIAAKSILPPNIFGYNKDVPEYEYSPAKAKELLKEAGYPNGFETTLLPAGAVRPYMPDPNGIAQEVANQLGQIGIKVKIIPASSWNEFLDLTYTKANYDLCLSGWIADSGDPNDFLTDLLASQSIGTYNLTLWRNQEFDNLLSEARAQSSSVRAALYGKAQLLVYEDAPLLPLFHSFQLAAWNDKVLGFRIHPTTRLFLRTVDMK